MRARRKFIRDCATLAAAAAYVPGSVAAAPRWRRDVPLGDVSFGVFSALLNTGFVVRDAKGNAQTLELIEAEAGASLADTDGLPKEMVGDSFSLVFRGDAMRPFSQDTYAFEHARIGRFEMFIVPFGCEDRSHRYYEAVFNRPPPESLPRPQLVKRSRTK